MQFFHHHWLRSGSAGLLTLICMHPTSEGHKVHISLSYTVCCSQAPAGATRAPLLINCKIMMHEEQASEISVALTICSWVCMLVLLPGRISDLQAYRLILMSHPLEALEHEHGR